MKKFFSVTAFSALLTLCRMCAGFVVAKVVAIYAGPSGIAMLGQFQSVVTSITGIVNAPAGSGVVRYTAENHNNGVDYCAPWWRACIYCIMGLSLIILPAVWFFSEELSQVILKDSEYSSSFKILALLIPFAAFGTMLTSILNGQQNFRRFISIGMVSVIFSSLIMLGFIYFYGLKGAINAVALQGGLVGVLVMMLCVTQPWFRFKYFFGKFNVIEIKKIGSYILMTATTALCIPISLVIIRKILVAHVGWESTGEWQAVWKISETYLTVITVALSTYYFPKLSKLNRVGEIKSEIFSVLKMVLPISILLAVLIYFSKDIIIFILFTEQFKGARDLFLIQLIGDVVKVASWLFAYPMLSQGATKWYISTEVLFSVSLISLTYICVSHFGVQGANIAYLANYILYFFVAYKALPLYVK
ncbi:O-antigen translocase [Erwinia sp. MYb535]|uniref:O-antigen translocase n=1 Tax=Erwinia sp. MYb535 TaxID=2745309 RepID=UPI0030A3A8E6